MKNKKIKNSPKNLICIGGTSINDETTLFTFTPDTPVNGSVTSFICNGKGQRLSNGTFMFTETPPRKRSRAKLIQKLEHGRLSYTADNAVQLTVKVFSYEDDKPMLTILNEVTDAIVKQIKRDTI